MPRSKVGIQTQWDSGEALLYNRGVLPRTVMGINVIKAGWWLQIAADNPSVKRVYRHHPNSDQVPGITPWQVSPEQAAVDFVAFLKGHLAGCLDQLELIAGDNEFILGVDHEPAERIALADRYMAAFVRETEIQLGKGVCVGNFNTGHYGPETVDLLPLTLAGLQWQASRGDFISYLSFHEYNHPELRDDGHWHTGKFLRAMPPILERYPNVQAMLTEVGVDRAAREWGAGHEGFRKVPAELGDPVALYTGDWGLAWLNDKLNECDYMHSALIFGCGMGDWRRMGFDIMNDEDDTAVLDRIKMYPGWSPPEPNGGDEMTIKVVDKEYKEQTEEWAKTKYGVAWRRAKVAPGQKVYRLVELWEKTGYHALVTQVLSEGGQPMANVPVTFYWPDAPSPPDPPTEVYSYDWHPNFVWGRTDVNGNVGPGMGKGAYHGEGEGGPHAVWVHDPNIPSDICEKLGMLAGTFHDHLDQKFKLMVEGEEPPPVEDGVLKLEEVLYLEHSTSALCIAYPVDVAVDTRGDGRGPGVDEDLHPFGWAHPDGREMAMVELCTDFEGVEPRTFTLQVYRMTDRAKLTSQVAESFSPLGAPRERVVYVFVKASAPPEPPPPDGDLLAEVTRTRKAVEAIRDHIISVPPEPPADLPFRGEYFANIELSGTPVLVRDDPVIDFSWGDGSPAPEIPADNFSVRWTGKRTFEAGTYRFHTWTDDGVRLWVDGELIVDVWKDQPPTEHVSQPVSLSAGQYDIKVEYYEKGGGAVARVWWLKRPREEVAMSKNPLKSRKFWYAIGTIIADVAITQIPELEPVRKELITVVTGLGVALILAIAGEDMAYWHGRKS